MYSKVTVENTYGQEIENIRQIDLKTREEKRAALFGLM